MGKQNTYWARFDNIEIGKEAAKKAGMAITGENPKLGLRLVGTPAQEAIYRREYLRLMRERQAQPD